MTGAKGKKRQSRLTFAPIADSPPSPSSRSAFTSRLRYSNPVTGKITVKGQLQLEDYVRNWGNSTVDGDKQGALSGNGQSSSDVDVKPNLIASSKQTQSYPTSISFEEGSSDDEVIRPSKRRRIASDALNDNESHEGSRQSSPSLDKASRLHEDNTDVDSKMGRRSAKETPRRRSQRLIASSPTETKSRRNSRKMDLSHIGEPEESDAVELASPATHRKRRKSTRKEKSASVVELDDSDVVVTSHTRKRQKSDNQIIHDQTDDEEGSSDDDIVAFTPSRRSLKSPQKSGDKDDGQKTPKTPKRSSEQDELDLEEDLEDLRDTVVREKRTRGTAVNSARSNRQKHLEMLRRRRAGEKVETDISEQEEEEEDSEPQQQQYHNTASLDWGAYLGAPDVSDSDAASIVEANEDLDADDSSFVEDDGELGVPADIPFEFSRHRTKHTRDCFRDVIEWMVHSKLNPAFRRNDDVYQFAFQKVSDEVVGRAGSQLTSSAWNADFVNTLRARPHLSVTGHPTDDGRSCDACNRSGHPASSALKFSGKPYSEETLEPLYESDSDSDSDDDSSDTSDEDSNKSDRDREGHILPPEQRHYYLGRTCKSNAVLTHTLIHWRFHLYEWVVDYLNAKEELLSNPQRSLDREKLSAKKRTKYANKVVDKMDADGEVQRLWTDFHQTIRTVREMKDVRQY